jgi:hypothetical protein
MSKILLNQAAVDRLNERLAQRAANEASEGGFLQGAGTMLVIFGLGVGVLIHTHIGAGMFLLGGLFLGLSSLSAPKVKL